jgi:hypothetical protein
MTKIGLLKVLRRAMYEVIKKLICSSTEETRNEW